MPLAGAVRALLHLDRLEALVMVPKAKALAEQHGMLWLLCVISCLEARLLYRLGRFAEGRVCAEAGLMQAQQAGSAEVQGFLHQVLADLYIAAGDLAQAQAQLELGEQTAQRLEQLQLLCELKGSRAELYQRSGDDSSALRAFREHAELQEKLHFRNRQLYLRAMSQQFELELLQREAQAERQRSAELLRANQELRDMQAQLTYQASRDPLTGLLNRAAFWARAQTALQEQAPGTCAGIIFADIDQLKAVNDTRGHAAGDALICEIARRFQAELGPSDLLGRLGGDEFMVYLADLPDPGAIGQVAERLLRSLDEPLHSAHLRLRPAASLGCAVAPQDSSDLGQLHQCADLALYQAKQQGKNTWMRFLPETGAAELRRQRLREDLHHALERGECELHYQPQFSLPDCRLIGVEALLRWRHPQLGMISPAEFIPLAEESLLILKLGTWVLRQACCQAQAWDFAARQLLMSVNVSVRQFECPDFVEQVQAALAACDLPGDCLVLELTETVLYQEAQLGARTVEDLYHLGVHTAIDDFGTGYSNMQLLRNLPFRQLKIDRSFVQDLGRTEGLASARHFMEVMLNLAHGLGIRVVAEGIETRQQLDLLSELGCDKGQGYLLSRPLPAEQLVHAFLC